MNLIDTHCHLYLGDFAPDIAEVIQRAEKEGVTKFYLPAVDSSSFGGLLRLEQRFPGTCIAMAGLHPCSVKSNYRDELKRVEDAMAARRFAAVGEIGLDFYWDRSFEREQYEAMDIQTGWAIAQDIPIVIHSRDSMKQTIEVVRKKQQGSLKGIFHCFNDSYESAQAIIGLGFYLGIGGVLTYKNSQLPAVLKKISLDYIVLETDAPYLSPVPFRGKRNESSYIKYVAAALAALKEISVEEVAAVTTANAEKIFGR